MSAEQLCKEIKQLSHTTPNCSQGLVAGVEAGEGLASLPGSEGRHSEKDAVLCCSYEPTPNVPPAEREQTDFQEWIQDKRMILSQMATDQLLLDGYSVSMPRQGYRKTETRLTLEVVENLLRPKTVRLEGLKGPGNERLVFADFDVLPEPYPSFEILGEVLSYHFGNRACVTASSGGHLKVMFRVDGKNWSKEEVRHFLAWQFSACGNLWAKMGQKKNKKGLEVCSFCIDRQGTDNTFINMDMLELFQQSYPKLHQFTSFGPEGKNQISSTQVFPSTNYSIGVEDSNPKSFKWNLYEGPLPEKILNLRNNDLLVKVFRMMAGSFYLSTTYGIALPQVQMKIQFGVSQPQISNAIHRLIREGVIWKIMNACHLQGMAAKYQFFGEYLEWAKKMYEGIKANQAYNNSPKKQKTYRMAVEARFRPGEMNLALFEYTRFFDSFQAYLGACAKHPYFGQKPEHVHQAEYSWKSRESFRKEEAAKAVQYLKGA